MNASSLWSSRPPDGRVITLAGNFPPPWQKAELKVGDDLILQLVRKG